jgi:hypothetical protein
MLTGIGETVEVLGETHIGATVEIDRTAEALCGKTLTATGTGATRTITDEVTVMMTDIGTPAGGSGSSRNSNAGNSQFIMRNERCKYSNDNQCTLASTIASVSMPGTPIINRHASSIKVSTTWEASFLFVAMLFQ